MKPVVVFIASFLVAAAAGAGASVTLHKGHARPADSLSAAGDSAAKDSVPGDSAARGGIDTGKGTADSTSLAKTLPAAAAPVPGAQPVQAKPAAGGAPDSAAAPERRLAKIFSSMGASEAAKTLEHMSDSDVQVILGYVGTRQAAAILAAMPADRAATLGKLALHGRGK